MSSPVAAALQNSNGISGSPRICGTLTLATAISLELSCLLSADPIIIICILLTHLVTCSPVVCVLQVEKKTFAEEVNNAFKEAANGALNGVLAVSDEPLVSVDFRWECTALEVVNYVPASGFVTGRHIWEFYSTITT